MNTVNIYIKQVLLSAIVLLGIGNSAIAQDSSHTARHFVGLYGGIDLSQTSRFTGILYEYMAYRGKQKELGLKVSYTFPYLGGNLIWFEGDTNEPSSTTLGLTATGYLYTNPQKMNTGFFINAEAGLSGSGWQFFTGLNHLLRPIGGLGFGWKWITKKGQAIRWSNGMAYAGGNMFSPATLTATTTLSIGF